MILNVSFSKLLVQSNQENHLFSSIYNEYALSSSTLSQIMALRCISNLFATNNFIKIIVEEMLPATLEAIVTTLAIPKTHKQYSHIRVASISLIFNLSLHIPKIDSDEFTQLLSSIVYQLQIEDDEENCYWLLLALGNLLFCDCSDSTLLVQSLGLDLTKWKPSSQKFKNVIQDIEKLLNSQ